MGPPERRTLHERGFFYGERAATVGSMFRHTIRTIGLAALLFALAVPGPAHAQTGTTAPAEHSGLSILLNVLGYSGFGGGLAFGSRALGVRGTAGWAPVIIGLDNGSGSTDVKFYSGFQAGGDAYLRIWSPQPTSDIGAQVGYRYSTLL